MGPLVGPLLKALRTETFLSVFVSHGEFVVGMDFTIWCIEMFDSDDYLLCVRVFFKYLNPQPKVENQGGCFFAHVVVEYLNI